MAANKFWKKSELTNLEQQVGVALTQIEQSVTEAKNLKVSSVVDYTAKINAKKQVYLVFIPHPCLSIYNKVSSKLLPELEKRLKATILVVAKRTIESKWVKSHRSQTRPNSRTLTSVYDGLLDDLVAPSTILGRRTRVRVDGTKFYRIFLDEQDKNEVEPRLDAIRAVYKLLTTRELEFEFRRDDVFYSKRGGAKKTTKK
ncbi:unnamed protein product [Paramecium octaurelia]|uniref:40S ribosomal protein S7 n=1 Tax=Paramecium octaurelia TaxID=43137 RepID=A0A8S1TYN7_PAROT|nr:unnamed protein product [Paramecium octaurelia]CAD8156599.1 unnamed protein product [Paramecium octaurelia]CAD8156603.1 unnamed protein product [Paramecium octaurelia]CAD8168823.1 unnamed protein product [Paramecium octaurelia]CAD8168825.1 unnamed protein product [Paramecium octaurelia]